MNNKVVCTVCQEETGTIKVKSKLVNGETLEYYVCKECYDVGVKIGYIDKDGNVINESE